MNRKSLNEIKIGEKVKVEELKCDNTIRRRMLDLGIVKGTDMLPVLKSPSGDPTAYEVRGSIIALRKEDAQQIKVKRK
ncbi:MAG: FeoA family protein [Clostridia bacterium]